MARVIAALIVCSILTAVTVARAQDEADTQIRTRVGPPITQNGDWNILSTGAWWIRVNQKGTNAREIRWELGTSATELDVPATLTRSLRWDGRGLPGDRELPITDRRLYPGNMTLWIWEHLREAPVIHVRATTTPKTASASFCVFYQQQGVELVNFSGKIDRDISVSTRVPQCAPPTR